ncbi:phytanoyl-CoA dioxygenase family protein [Roseomonas sp. CCTCC AB2023176]|uniref:phytanoyl-CoA dioxygenase family protein n=1 Tax=Roseomonas sp. CCTCC AB2023176 TaxID=3342640 RepID=UPI0035E013D9
MGTALTEAEVSAYRERGYLSPLRALSEGEVAGARAAMAATEARVGEPIAGRLNQKPHLILPWVADLIRHPRVLDAVEDVLGPDLFCWGAQFFAKPAGDPAFVSWHQDGTYWGLSSQDVVTAWIALTPSVPESGCMRVVPGTHLSQVPHTDTFAETNMLSRGQEIAVEVRDADAVDVVLQPGEMSLHHVLIFHGSERNRAAWPRVGFAVRYVPTHVRQLSGEKDSATLVRGTDRYGHFEHERAPREEMGAAEMAHHAEVLDRQLAILYRGAEKAGKLGTTPGFR